MVIQNMASKHFSRLISHYPTHISCRVIYSPSPICPNMHILFVPSHVLELPSPKSFLLLSICSNPNQTFTFSTTLLWLAPFGTSHFLHPFHLWTSSVLSVLPFGTHQKLPLYLLIFNLWKIVSPTRFYIPSKQEMIII